MTLTVVVELELHTELKADYTAEKKVACILTA